MRLKEKYKKQIVPKLKEKFNYRNNLMAPKLIKAVVNVSFGRDRDKAYLEKIERNLAAITGQKPIFTKAKKAISAFKIRQGMIIGAKITLRGARMYDFVERLINIAFPRVRDFRGLKESIVDEKGSLTVGLREYLAFPEVIADETGNIHGLEVSIVSTAKTREEAMEFFKLLGFPLKHEENENKQKKTKEK